MWPVEIVWKNIKFWSSDHVYVYEMLQWHGKLTNYNLQVLFTCHNSFIFIPLLMTAFNLIYHCVLPGVVSLLCWLPLPGQ